MESSINLCALRRVIVALCAASLGTLAGGAQTVALQTAQAPLVQAARNGQAEAVRALLQQGVDVNTRDTAGHTPTPLMAAVMGNHADVVKQLIAAHANLNAATRGTGTAVELAERMGEPDIAALLLAAGARSSGESVGDTVCVRPWQGDGFCGTVMAFTIRAVQLDVTRVIGCAHGCQARQECSASKPVGGNDGLQAGEKVTVPSWCLTQTGVKLSQVVEVQK